MYTKEKNQITAKTTDSKIFTKADQDYLVNRLRFY